MEHIKLHYYDVESFVVKNTMNVVYINIINKVGFCMEPGLVVSVEYNKLFNRHEIVLIREYDNNKKTEAITLILESAKQDI